jgi:hypothetical protein
MVGQNGQVATAKPEGTELSTMVVENVAFIIICLWNRCPLVRLPAPWHLYTSVLDRPQYLQSSPDQFAHWLDSLPCSQSFKMSLRISAGHNSAADELAIRFPIRVCAARKRTTM